MNRLETGTLTYFYTWGQEQCEKKQHKHGRTCTTFSHLSLSKVWQHDNAPASMCFLTASRKAGAISVDGFDWWLLVRRLLLDLWLVVTTEAPSARGQAKHRLVRK